MSPLKYVLTLEGGEEHTVSEDWVRRLKASLDRLFDGDDDQDRPEPPGRPHRLRLVRPPKRK